ncbi:TPA: helix-turn-helix transcriptional regulator [Pseudomonas putida]|uniref:Helix-turn-helix transcriptional regulator n=2 Tax=Pseudomonas putida TaxID=303 RepID=A0AAP9SQE7_PSEPU|nr:MULTISPECIES: helix-turn-helix transcriptional regulator [Pseudomonas]MBH3473008.1 helix-turn-helix transcriptional regulator [Pseudomonas putida]MCE0968969.1 helix-turn-helix domain-containing protein [Pseudomonas sp. NMI4491_12]MDG9874142.1 helix-turn-helix domain-containing protein [Pseudomonas juntendi]QJQ11622.1 helix-turn-helix transcriptional regulator [Pseudomonas putida]
MLHLLERFMLPRHALAAVIRALRAIKGVSQAELPADRKHLYKLEAGLSNISLDMLVQLAQSLDVAPATLVVLLQAIDQSSTPDSIIDRVRSELVDFDRLGGTAELGRQVELGGEQSRNAAIEDRTAAIQACKAKGLTQRQTAAELALSKSTVARAW